jgi:hypothetical protein
LFLAAETQRVLMPQGEIAGDDFTHRE